MLHHRTPDSLRTILALAVASFVSLPIVCLANPRPSSPEGTASLVPTFSPPTVAPPTPTVPSVPYVCESFAARRGPGTWSLYGNGPRRPWRPEHIHQIYFTIRQGSTVVAQASYFIDPCNREYGNFPGCYSNRGLMPGSFGGITYPDGGIPTWTSPAGRVFQLLTVPLHTVDRNAAGQVTRRHSFRAAVSSWCAITLGDQVSPLVVDLTGAGITFTDPSKQVVRFDLGRNTGTTSWIANPKSVAFLGLDRNENKVIDDVQELFGDETYGPSAALQKDGFAALSEYDTNKDRIIDERDPIFAELLLWNDTNTNGKSEADELRSASSTVRSIALVSDEKTYFGEVSKSHAQGRSEVSLKDGKKVWMYDAWFVPGLKAPVAEDVSGVSGSLPLQGSKEHTQVSKDLAALLKEDGWLETDTSYERGTVVTLPDAATKTASNIYRWPLGPKNECFAQLQYSASGELYDKIVACR